MNDDYRNRDALVAEFKRHLTELQADDALEEWEKVSAAIGVAVYDPSEDAGIDSVFRRADNLMYENKKKMKAARA